MASFHDFEVETISGETKRLADYAGQHCLVVNVASK
jgi:glutathione peroxidase-family protein